MNPKIHKILCVTDLSDFSNAAIPYAVALAERLGSRLFLGHVTEKPIDRSAEGEVRHRLEKLVNRESLGPVSLVSYGNVVDEIARMIRYHRIDLLVLASHGRSGIERLVLGSTAETLIRTLSGPILVVPPADPDSEAAPEQPIGFKRILVGSDFSQESDMAFGYGVLFAQAFESELHLVHVLDIPYSQNLLITALEVEEGVREETRKELNADLSKRFPEELYDRCLLRLNNLVKDSRCNSRTAVLEGSPFPSLTEYAEANGIELIVLGGRGPGLAKTLFIGSTPDRIIRRGQFPVLSVCPTCPT